VPIDCKELHFNISYHALSKFTVRYLVQKGTTQTNE